MADPGTAPYVGPRPFDREERARFFGRGHEARALASLIVAHRVVLLYAASGAGKTSLLNAGVIPSLEDDDDFEVFPPVRLRGLADPLESGNPYVENLLGNLARGAGDDDPPEPTLAAFLAARPRRCAHADLPAPRALVIDQFEELFTLYPERWQQRAGVFDQLREALEQDPLLRVVLAIREDFIAQLDRYADLVPTRLRARMRLEPLRRPAALEAIALPLAGEARSFSPGVAEQLVDDLLKVRIHTFRDESIETPGEFVEPVQLQVVCRTLWSSLPPEVQEIGEDDLARIGSVAEVLSNYYGEAVRAAAAAGGVSEYQLRERLEAAFVTAVGTRGTVVGGGERIAGIPKAAIDELEARHLVRAEWRAGARWYELTHDSLIRPIVSSNAALRRVRERKRVRRLTGAVAGLLAVAGVLAGLLLLGRDQPVQRAQARTLGVLQRRAPLAGLRLAMTLRASAVPVAMSTTPGGRGLFVAADDGRIRVWDLNTGGEVRTLDYGDAGLLSVDASQDVGEIVAAGTLGVKTWNTFGLGSRPPGSVRFSGPQVFEASDRDATTVTGAAFAPGGYSLLIARDGRGVLTSGFGDTTGTTVAQDMVRVAYSPRGTAIVGVAPDGTARLRRMRFGRFDPPAPRGAERVLRAPGRIAMAAFSPDGSRVVTASSDGVARLWRTRDGRLVEALRAGRAALADARLSPDGSLVATAGTDGVLRIIPAAGGSPVAVVRAGTRPLSAVRWAATGQLVVTAGADGTVRVWANAAPHRPLSAPCTAAQFQLPATPGESGARAGDGRLYVGSVGCAAHRGDVVVAPEAGTAAGACGRPQRGRVALETADGRCWVFLGVDPQPGLRAVKAGAPIGTVGRVAGDPLQSVRIELWATARGGHRMFNLWNPKLFVDVRPSRYPPWPGDNASRAAVASWMGAWARASGLPRELPVMAGLVESGLKNLNFGDRDSVGLFQMRLGRWNHGAYAGFPSRPDIQMRWFIDRARLMRARLSRQGRDPMGHPGEYGAWAADVTQPPSQYRGRFQLRLDEARQLLALPVTQPARVEPGGGGPAPLPAEPVQPAETP
jgi:hypothetical protein